MPAWCLHSIAASLNVMCLATLHLSAQKETAHRIMYSNHIDFPARHSAAWRDFVRRALQKQPHLRPTAAQLLAHPWLKPPPANRIPRSPASQPVPAQSSPTSTAHAASLKARLGSLAISASVHAASALAPAPSVSTASCEADEAVRANLATPFASHAGPVADADAEEIALKAPAEAEFYTAPSSPASTAETSVSAVSSMASELPDTADQAPTASSAFANAGSSAAWCTDSFTLKTSRADGAGSAVAARLAGRAAGKTAGITVLRAGLALLHAPASAERPFSSSTPASPLARPRLRTLPSWDVQASISYQDLHAELLKQRRHRLYMTWSLLRRVQALPRFCDESCLAASGEALGGLH